MEPNSFFMRLIPQALSEPIGRFVFVVVVAGVVVPILFFAATFVSKVVDKYRRFKRNEHACDNLPQHPIRGLALKMLDPNTDFETKISNFVKDTKTGEMYDLVGLGSGIDGRQAISIFDAELAAGVLSSPDPTEYPKAPVYEEIVADALLGDGLVTTSNMDRWSFHRKLLTPLFHFKTLKDMIPMMTLYTQDLVSHLQKEGEKWHSVSDVLSRFTLSQIVWLAFGGAMDIDWIHKRQIEIGHTWHKYAALHMFFGKMIQYVPFTPAWEVMKLRKETESVMYSIIAQVRKEGLDSQSQQHNLIATMLNAKNPKTGRTVTDKDIVEEACTMLFAGFDTTSTTMSWTLYYLARDPDAMRWVQQELDETFGTGASARTVTAEDLPKLKRTRAIINETLRLRPPLLIASRWTQRETKLGPYTIPEDTIVSVNIFMLHRNPKYWKDPNDFVPKRWEEASTASDQQQTSDKDEELEKGVVGGKTETTSTNTRHNFAFIPFSAGSRNCVGKNFAIQEMVIALSMLLSRFDIVMDTSRPMRVVGTPVPTPVCYVKFVPRF